MADIKHLVFIDNFVTIYHLDGITDYQTKIYVKDFHQDPNFLEQVNQNMSEIKELFPHAILNLNRKAFVVDSAILAFSLLRNLLKYCQIPFEVGRTSQTTYLRLTPVNFTLVYYIKHTMESKALAPAPTQALVQALQTVPTDYSLFKNFAGSEQEVILIRDGNGKLEYTFKECKSIVIDLVKIGR